MTGAAVMLRRAQAKAHVMALGSGWCHACDRPVARDEPCGCPPGSIATTALDLVISLSRLAGVPESALGSVRSSVELLQLVDRWLTDQTREIDPCPGEGRCHGPMSWCDWCGDVDHVCDDTTATCDTHYGRYRWCAQCGSQHPFDEPCWTEVSPA